MEKYTLYHFSTCPYCTKVKLALKALNLNIPMKNIRSNSKYKDELINGGGKKQVPCLRIEKECGLVEWMYESSDIIHYLKSQNKDSQIKSTKATELKFSDRLVD